YVFLPLDELINKRISTLGKEKPEPNFEERDDPIQLLYKSFRLGRATHIQCYNKSFGHILWNITRLCIGGNCRRRHRSSVHFFISRHRIRVCYFATKCET